MHVPLTTLSLSNAETCAIQLHSCYYFYSFLRIAPQHNISQFRNVALSIVLAYQNRTHHHGKVLMLEESIFI